MRYRKQRGVKLTPKQRARLRGLARAQSRKKPRLTNDLRKEAAQHAVTYGAAAAAEKYNVTERTIVRWKKWFGLSWISKHPNTTRHGQ